MSSMTLSKESADAVIPVERQAAAELDTLYVGLVRDYHRRIYNYVFRIVGDSASLRSLSGSSITPR